MQHDLNLDGVCIVCRLPTPVSRNTITTDGIVCGECEVMGRSPEAARRMVAERISALEAELRRLRRQSKSFA